MGVNKAAGRLICWASFLTNDIRSDKFGASDM